MAITLPDLPYPLDALEPQISKETLEFHYGKHHATYVTKLNGLIEGTDQANADLETIVRSSSGGIFNNAAQVWNHTFYWNCMTPNGKDAVDGALGDAINAKFGSFAEFKDQFSKSAATNFGSGWTWLVKKADGSVDIDLGWTPATNTLPIRRLHFKSGIPVTTRVGWLKWSEPVIFRTAVACRAAAAWRGRASRGRARCPLCRRPSASFFR